MSGCTISNCAVGILTGRNGEDCDNLVISNNNIGNCSYGLYTADGTNITVVGNNFFGTFVTKHFTNVGTIIAINQSITDGYARSIYWNNDSPSSGTYQTGDICLDSTGATLGWHCTAGGSPGTWSAIIA